MGARQKLNRIYLTAILVAGAGAGWLTGSWLVFGIAFAALIAGGLYAGDIRTNRQIRR